MSDTSEAGRGEALQSGDAATEQQVVDHAHQVKEEIETECLAIRRSGVRLAGALHRAQSDRVWEPLGYESEKHWLAEPPIELSYSHARNLSKVYREVVIERGVDEERLGAIDLRKLQMALPAVKEGQVSIDEAISDAETLGRSDMAARYDGDPQAALDPGSEPEYAECPTCGSYVGPEKLEEAA